MNTVRLAVRLVLVTQMVGMVVMRTTAQHVSSSRGLGIGAYTAIGGDLSSIDWNAAGLMRVRDWEISVSNILAFGTKTSFEGFSLHTLGATKRFLDDHAVALRFAPGSGLNFLVPSIFQFEGSTQQIEFDKKISYREPYAIAYAYRVGADASLGISARFQEEQVSETQPFIEQDTIARIKTVDYSSTSWVFDIGFTYALPPTWTLAVVAKNLFKMKEEQFPHDIQAFALQTLKKLRVGLAYTPLQDLHLGLDLATDRHAAIGWEWHVVSPLTVRQGSYLDLSSPRVLQAVSAGIGGTYESIRLDVSYIHFLDPQGRTQTTLQDFIAGGVSDIGYNRFTTNQFVVTMNVSLGRTRETVAKIEHVRILNEVFPSSYQVHAYRPLGKAVVRNVSDGTIEARVGFFLKAFMDKPTESKPHIIPPKSELEIPFYAVFNEAIQRVSSMVLRPGDVYVKASPVNGYDDTFQTQLIIRGRNEWDGDVSSLRHFVTPDDPDVMQFTRTVLYGFRDSLSRVPGELSKFVSTAILFNAFAGRLVYVHDPRTSKDRVQFPSETLSLRGGDCDDMSVGIAAMLISTGVSAAFVDVIPPDRPREGHVFLLVDTGVEAGQAALVSDNPKRYVIRKNEAGKETVWIPLETTVVTEGFERAWEVAADEYYEQVERNLGLVRGWVKIVDIMTK